MDKSEYLAQLRTRLAGRMGEEELNNALSYYEEYFEDAGCDHEQEVIEHLGSPEAVAAQVLGEQELRYVPPVKRRSHAGIIVLCAVLGVLFVGIALLLIFSLAGFNNYTQESRISVEPQISATGSEEPVKPSVSAMPSVSAPPIVREDGETAFFEENNLAAFSKISVSVGIGSVVIEEGSSYALSMDWYVHTSNMSWSNEDGRLKIWSGALLSNSNQRGGTVRITVPKGTVLEECDLETGLGEIEFKDCALAGELDIFTGLGNIDLSGAITGELELETGMGDIDMELSGDKADYGLDFETGMGTVKLDGEKKGTGYETSDSKSSLDCSTGMGDIKVSFFVK